MLITGIMTLENDSQPRSYSLEPVPDFEQVSGWKVAQVVFGIGITLPVFWLGASTTLSLGFSTSLLLFFLVNTVFGSFTALTSIVGSRTRLSTYMILKFPFGRTGSLIVNFIMAVTFLGFYAATVAIFGDTVTIALRHLFGIETPVWLHILWGSVVMTGTSIYGFKAMDRLSILAVPLLLVFMLVVIAMAVGQGSLSEIIRFEGEHGSVSEASSGLIGMMILSVVMMPDFSRFARSDRDALIAILGLLIGFPVVLVAGGVPAITTGKLEIMEVMAILGLTLPAILVLVFSTWTTNTANIYSSTLTLRTVFTRSSSITIHIVTALVATGLAIAGFMNYFLNFIILLSIVVPPVASIYVLDFFWVRKQNYNPDDIDALPAVGWPAIIAWVMASGVSWLTMNGTFTLSTLPTIDGLVVALGVYALLAPKQQACCSEVPECAVVIIISDICLVLLWLQEGELTEK